MPFLAEDVVVEELQAIAIDLDGRPGAVADEPIEVLAEFVEGKGVGGAVEMVSDASRGTGVDIDGGRRFSLAS